MTQADVSAEAAPAEAGSLDTERCFSRAYYVISSDDNAIVACMDHTLASLAAFMSAHGINGAHIGHLTGSHRCSYRFDAQPAELWAVNDPGARDHETGA